MTDEDAEGLISVFQSLGYRANRGKRYYSKMIVIRTLLSDREFNKVRALVREVCPTATVERPVTAHVLIRW